MHENSYLDSKHPEIREELIRRFIQHCVKDGLHPEDAAKEVGVPFALMLIQRKKDPRLEVAWFDADQKKPGTTHLSRVQPQQIDALTLKDSARHKIFVEKDLVGKIANAVERITNDDEGDEKLLNLMRAGLIRDLLPKESAIKSQTVPFEAELMGKTPEELDAMDRELEAKRKVRELERKLAAEARMAASRKLRGESNPSSDAV